MRGVKHILFDLDHTLWDCDGNSVASLRNLYRRFGAELRFESFEAFNSTYQAINDELWAALPDSGMSVEEVRLLRFVKTLESAGQSAPTLGETLAEEYMRLMVSSTMLMPFAKEVLAELKPYFSISVATNGIAKVQRGKMSSSGLTDYVERLFISDEIGAMKPKREYFDHVLDILRCKPSECVMVGDNPATDIKGALDNGLRAIWYNSRHVDANVDVLEISDLRQLKEILI